MSFDVLLGMDAVLYFQREGTREAWPDTGVPPNLEEVDNVRNLTANLDHAEADATTRGNNGWRATEPTLKEASIDFNIVFDADDSFFRAVRNAWLNKTKLALAVLSGAADATGTEGLWADFKVSSFKKNEELEDVQSVDVTVKPAYSAVPPEWVTVGVS